MIRKFFWYFLSIIIFTLLYILSFSLVPQSFFNIPLLGPIGILVVLSILMVVVLKCINYYFSIHYFDGKDITIVMILAFFINYNVYGMIPFNTSRSNSIIIVGYLLQNEGQPKSEKDIENFVKTTYFDKYHAIQMRLDEQTKAGNIAEVNGKYYLTSRGKFITQLFADISDLYRTKRNFARPDRL